MFCETFCSMIIWFWYSIVSSSFCCQKLNISIFSQIFHIFSKNCIVHQIKKAFHKIIFSFFLAWYSYQYMSLAKPFWLNLMTLWTILKTNPWFSAYFKCLMWITYSVLSCKLVINFSNFLNFILSGKSGKPLWSSGNFLRHWTSTLRK